MMLVFEGVNVPAVEWCSIDQALLWINDRQVPVSWKFDAMIPDRLTTRGTWDGHFCLRGKYRNALDRLLMRAGLGRIELRGAALAGFIAVHHSANKSDYWTGPPILEVDFGAGGCPEIARIPSEYFTSLSAVNCDIDMYCLYHNNYDVLDFDSMLYYAIEVRFADLLKIYPASSESTQHKQTPATCKNVGGRPRKWDWEGCIAATMAAIFAGTIKEEDRPAWNQFMANWFSSTTPDGDCPDDGEIRKRARLIEGNLKEMAG